MLRSLFCSPRWCGLIEALIEKYFSVIGQDTELNNIGASDFACILAALDLLGGHQDTIRPGGMVRVVRIVETTPILQAFGPKLQAHNHSVETISLGLALHQQTDYSHWVIASLGREQHAGGIATSTLTTPTDQKVPAAVSQVTPWNISVVPARGIKFQNHSPSALWPLGEASLVATFSTLDPLCLTKLIQLLVTMFFHAVHQYRRESGQQGDAEWPFKRAMILWKLSRTMDVWTTFVLTDQLDSVVRQQWATSALMLAACSLPLPLRGPPTR